MRLAALLLACAAAAFAQSPDGISTTATRNVTIAPDQADFTMLVMASLDSTPQQIGQIFQEAGLPDVKVNGVAVGQNSNAYPPPTDSQVYYQVTLTTQPANVRDYSRKLDALRASLPTGVSSIQYSALLTPSAPAVEKAHQEILPQLLADARTSAQNLAAAAGLKLGAIVAVTESSYAAYGLVQSAIFSPPFFSSSGSNTNGTQFTFYASVRFAAQ